MRLLFIILWSIPFLSVTNAQKDFINFDIWEANTTKVGSQVTDIFQDGKGYIWLSTFNGVIRFDGSEFIHLSEIYPASDQIPGSHISCVRIDTKDNIWIGTIEEGMFMLDRNGDLFSFNDHLIKEGRLDEYRIKDVVFQDSLMFVIGRRGLHTFKNSNGGFTRIENITTEADRNVRSMLKYNDDVIFATRTSIHSLKGSVPSIEGISSPQLFFDKNNVLWKSTVDDKGTMLFVFDNNEWTKNTTQPFQELKEYRTFTWDYQNRLWGVKYIDNLICYNFKNDRWLIQKGQVNHNLDQRRIRDVMVDNSGTVWIGSDVVSLFRKSEDVRSVKLEISNQDEVSNFVIDNDKLIYSTGFEGIHIVDSKGIPTILNTQNSALASDRFVKITPIDSAIFGVHHVKGFQIWDGDKSFSNLFPFKGSNRAMCFHEGYYWVGGVSNLIRIDPKTLESKKYSFASEYRSQNIYINALIPKSANEMYVGSNLKELSIFKIIEEEFVPLLTNSGDIKSLKNCNHLSISSNNLLAIASEKGLFIYDGNKYEKIVASKYFKSVNWYGINLLMASTIDEIYKYDLKTREISVLTQEDGLLNNQFALRSTSKTDSEICFGGNQGLDCIHYSTPVDTLSTLLNLESFIINNANRVEIESTNGDIIQMPSDTRLIELQLNQIYTKSQGSARIIYKSDNEAVWHPLPGNKLVLNNPRKGLHSFEFRSSIDNYLGKDRSLNVKFEIPVPWYSQSWFSILISLVLMSIASWWIIRFQNRKKEKQIQSVQLKADIAELRLKALSGQMNPHFMFNSLNSILQMISEKDLDNATLYVQKFSRMLRFVLEYSDQSWVSLEEEINFLKDYLLLEKMRFNDSFDYTLEVDYPNALDTKMLPPFFIQPKIENALKHGIRGLYTRGKITIQLKVRERTLCVSIRDNGIGRDAARSKQKYQNSNTNKGIELTRKRLEQLNKMGYEASLQVIDLYEENEPSGTEVKLILPLKPNER